MRPQFIESSPDIIASVTQRWLFSYWNSLRGNNPLPLWSRLAPGDFVRVRDNLCFLDVMPDGDEYRIQIRYMGTIVERMHGANCVGKYLDDVIPAQDFEDTLATYRHAIAELSSVYCVSSLSDSRGQTVSLERLLLPFSDVGRVTARIVASLEAISREGRFESAGLFHAQQLTTLPQIRATIVAPDDLAGHQAATKPPDNSDRRPAIET